LATPNALLFSISVCLCAVASQTEENFMQRFYFWGGKLSPNLELEKYWIRTMPKIRQISKDFFKIIIIIIS
jgi:hypothetical protein